MNSDIYNALQSIRGIGNTFTTDEALTLVNNELPNVSLNELNKALDALVNTGAISPIPNAYRWN